MTLHTKSRKFYNARPLDVQIDFKGECCGYVEGFDGYLYSKKWAVFLITELKNPKKKKLIRNHR